MVWKKKWEISVFSKFWFRGSNIKENAFFHFFWCKFLYQLIRHLWKKWFLVIFSILIFSLNRSKIWLFWKYFFNFEKYLKNDPPLTNKTSFCVKNYTKISSFFQFFHIAAATKGNFIFWKKKWKNVKKESFKP